MEQGQANERRTWLRETLARYEGALLRYAARLTGDADLARDVVQDVFSRLCAEKHGLEAGGAPPRLEAGATKSETGDAHKRPGTGAAESGAGNVRNQTKTEAANGTAENHVAAWLFAVCRNRAIDVRRKEGRMRSLPEVELDARPHPAALPADAAETSDALAGVLRLLAMLPEKQQEAVRLKFQAGLSYKEIADVLKLSIGNVGFLIHTALKTIREKMGPR